MYKSKFCGPAGLAMSERERREDEADGLVILRPAIGYGERGGQQRFAAGRIMKSPREVLIRAIALSLAAILLTSLLVAEAYSHATPKPQAILDA
jgi:hypothetical protein